ncbi:MAG: hypothetical protein V2A73_14695 [Pseudomonadota bacterium]
MIRIRVHGTVGVARRFAPPVLGLLFFCGCASSPRIPVELVDRLPPEGKAAIHESENEVIIARNSRDLALEALARARAEARELDERWERAQARLKKAKRLGDVGLAKKVVDARQRHADARVELAETRVECADAAIGKAIAKLDKTKYGELVRFGAAPGSGMTHWEQRVADAEKGAEEAQRREINLQAKALEFFEGWKRAEQEYIQTAGDHDTCVWID